MLLIKPRLLKDVLCLAVGIGHQKPVLPEDPWPTHFSTSNASKSAHLEGQRLFKEWLDVLAHFSVMISRVSQSPLSVEQWRALHVQVKKAQAQAQDYWARILIQRVQCGCNGVENLSGSSENDGCSPVPPIMPVAENMEDCSSKKRLTAGQRRDCELRELRDAGVPIVFCGRWQASIGPLHIWPHAGRWNNHATRKRGKIHSVPMRTLIWGQLLEISAFKAEDYPGGHTTR